MTRVMKQFNIDFEEQRASDANNESARLASTPIRSYLVTEPVAKPVMIYAIDSTSGEAVQVPAVELAQSQQKKIRDQAEEIKQLRHKVDDLEEEGGRHKATIEKLEKRIHTSTGVIRELRAELATASDSIKPVEDLISKMLNDIGAPLSNSDSDSLGCEVKTEGNEIGETTAE